MAPSDTPHRLIRWVLLGGAAAFVLAGCASYERAPPAYQVTMNPAPASAPFRPAEHIADAGATDLRSASFEQIGSGQMVAPSDPRTGGQGNITINLVDVPVTDAIQQVLGEILRQNYVVETQLQGDVTLQTSRPVTRDGALRLLSAVLASRNAELLDAGEFYRIVALGRGDTASSAGGARIIAPRYVSAEGLKSILSGSSDRSLSIETDPVRNVLILRGNASAVAEAEKLASVFDVNWLRNMSFAAVPVTYASPTQLVSDLETVLGATSGGPLSGVARFVPLDRLNSIVVISPQPGYITEAKAWIERLDRSGGQGGQRLFVIPIQNRPATEVAAILTETLGGDSQMAGSGAGLRPGDAQMFTSTSGEGGSGTLGMAALGGAAQNAPAARIIADDANNSIVVLASSEQISILENAIARLDAMASQVFLEATIAEVTLTDSLAYGLTWFFQSGEFRTTFSDADNGAVASQFPGLSILYAGSNARAALSAVAGVTDVKVLSAPSLMVLDNRTATLQVGDQVPIVTQSAVSVTNPDAPIVNSVSLRDTGIILNVTPRVNDGGLVILEIDQEVSDVVSTSSSGIDSPTIQQRRISTSVSVRDGESVALGGLMRERLSDSRQKVPLLGDIPLLGNVFTTKRTSSTRTELLVMITPRVVRSTDATLSVTDDLVRRMKMIEDTFVIRPMEPVASIETEAPGAS